MQEEEELEKDLRKHQLTQDISSFASKSYSPEVQTKSKKLTRGFMSFLSAFTNNQIQGSTNSMQSDRPVGRPLQSYSGKYSINGRPVGVIEYRKYLAYQRRMQNLQRARQQAQQQKNFNPEASESVGSDFNNQDEPQQTQQPQQQPNYPQYPQRPSQPSQPRDLSDSRTFARKETKFGAGQDSAGFHTRAKWRPNLGYSPWIKQEQKPMLTGGINLFKKESVSTSISTSQNPLNQKVMIKG